MGPYWGSGPFCDIHPVRPAFYRRTTSLTSAFSYARLVGISRPPSGQMTASYSAPGTTHTDIWEISSDGSLKMFWTNGSGGESELGRSKAHPTGILNHAFPIS